jgi:3-deoxy-D-manno-octulosonic-acid transferase
MWILLYRILYLPAFLIALPYYGMRMWKRGGYGKDFAQRLGFFPQLAAKQAGRPRIWLQAVSVGEVLSVGELIRELKLQLDAEIVLTTTTSTGYAEARKRYAAECLVVGLFPLDFVCFNRRSWQRIDPDMVITMESELWPEHLHQVKRSKVPLYVVNARLSDRSFRRYNRIRFLAKRLLGKPVLFFPSSAADAQRLHQLGVAAERMHSIGNIKMDVAPRTPITEAARKSLRRDLGFLSTNNESEPLVLLGASTWPGEEVFLLEILQACKERGIDCRLLLVPRHAERRGEIIRLLSRYPFPHHVRSRDGKQAQSSVSIHLADTTGELSQLAQSADVAFIGKSLPPNIGGQTPIEAVSLGLPTVMGPQMENFRSVVSSLLTAEAAIQARDAETAREALLTLLSDPSERKKLTSNSREWTQKQTGVSEKIAAHLTAEFRRFHQSSTASGA